MQRNLWSSLEVLSTQAALLMEWQRALGPDFPAARAYLRPTQEQSGSYPCTDSQPCGCRHRVTYDSPDDITALCDCDPPDCHPIPLRPADLIVYAMDTAALAGAIRVALQLDTPAVTALPSGLRSHQAGLWGPRRRAVYFHVPISEKATLQEIARLAAVAPEPFILLTPTARFGTALVQRDLRPHGAENLILDGKLALASTGSLEIVPSENRMLTVFFEEFEKRAIARKGWEKAIARIDRKLDEMAQAGSAPPSPNNDVPEDVARQAFALLEKLEADTRIRSAPPLTVFRLYCVNGLSIRQTARRCACSAATICNRLNLIHRRTGVHPDKLRAHSAQFERMEDSLSDSRARRIYRKDLTDDIADGDDSS